VLVLTMLVSGLWGGWMVLRTVVEPIEELRDTATSIAEGERDIDVGPVGSDEIGDLAHALEDMTQQLERQERELLDSYRSLEVALHEKTDLAQRLERTIGMKSDFVAVASHELRSPLAVIQLYSEMLEDNEFGDLDPALADAVDAIVSAVGRLSLIVQSLLDVALLERGLMHLQYTDVAVHDIVDQAVTDAGILARAVGVDVSVSGTPAEVYLRGDEVRLRQALDNLLSNAVKYSPEGGQVEVSEDVDGSNVHIRVADRGSGIDPERADVLFELFGRTETRDDAEVTGLGLGLPISDRIVRAHGGTITFEPTAGGKGTTFIVRLPLRGAPDEAPDSIGVV
jgi:signal transduction histidine kinase